MGQGWGLGTEAVYGGRELRDRDWSRGGSHGPGMGAWDGGCVWGTGAEAGEGAMGQRWGLGTEAVYGGRELRLGREPWARDGDLGRRLCMGDGS